MYGAYLKKCKDFVQDIENLKIHTSKSLGENSAVDVFEFLGLESNLVHGCHHTKPFERRTFPSAGLTDLNEDPDRQTRPSA